MSRVHRSRNPSLQELARLTVKQFCKAATAVIHGRRVSRLGRQAVHGPPCAHPNLDTGPGFDGAASTGTEAPENSEEGGAEPQTGSPHSPGLPPAPLAGDGPLSQTQDQLLQAPGGAPLPRAQPPSHTASPSTRRHQGSVAKEIKKRKPRCCELWGKAGFSPTLTPPRRPPLSLPPPISPSALGTQGHSCWALSLHTHLSPLPGLGTGAIFQEGSGGRENKACSAEVPGTGPKS